MSRASLPSALRDLPILRISGRFAARGRSCTKRRNKTEALPGGQGLRRARASYFFFARRRLRAGFLAAFFAVFRLAALRLGAAFFRVVFFAAALFAVLRRFGAALRAVFFAADVRFFAVRFLAGFFAARRFLGGIGCHPLSILGRKVYDASFFRRRRSRSESPPQIPKRSSFASA